MATGVAMRLRPGRVAASARLWILGLGAAGPVLGVLLLLGALLRVLAMVAWWPVATTLADSGAYAVYAASDPLADPQHPAGYAASLAVLGVITHKVVVLIALQHILGLVAPVVMFAAVRRLTGSAWPALVPAAVILLDGDQIFLEHNVMSEGPFVALFACVLYAAVRSLEEPTPSFRWPALAAVLAVAATVVRSAALVFIPVFAVAMLASRGDRRQRWLASGVIVATAIVLLAGYAVASKVDNGRLEIGPATGWHLYGRAAPFADCRRFTPPAGTRGLCETTPPAQRPGPEFYLYDSQSPAVRMFGSIGQHDEKLGAFARAAIRHQPGDFLSAVWDDIRSYYVPSSHRAQPFGGVPLSPELDWNRDPGHTFTRTEILRMERFFSGFTQRKSTGLLGFLNGYSRIFRFGATLLFITTLLTLIGLFVVRGRIRAGILIFGIAAILQLVVPSVAALYVGRYTVPLAGSLSAAAAVSCWSLWRRRLQEPRSAGA